MTRPFAQFSYSLSAAAELVSAEKRNFVDLDFTGLSHKDSEIEPGDLFLAFPGSRVHGAEFADRAIAAGAVAVLTDSAGASMVSGVPTLVVSNVRHAGAVLASALYRSPVSDMQSIGITGTNGKTTVTTLLHQIFTRVGRDAGLIGTVETLIGNERIRSERTTPEAANFQALAATMRERHMRHLVMEVSSHSLDLYRVAGSHFSIVGFTNLTQDHLDYHKDMESYFAAKSRLFTYEYTDLAFINIDDPYGLRLFNAATVPSISISRLNQKATWHYDSITTFSHGAEFRIRGRDGILIEARTPLLGAYNLDNLLLAIAIAYECGIDPLEIASITPQLFGAPGRLEAISLGQNFTALVDYAHSPDAVTNVLQAAREFTSGRLIVVLGCGGDRDRSKRPLMGEALHQGSDIAIFTSDNPRSENPERILSEMVGALSVVGPSRVIEDRGEAIAYAVAIANEGDSVLVLGKGHERGQEINGEIFPFDDRIHIAEAIEERR